MAEVRRQKINKRKSADGGSSSLGNGPVAERSTGARRTSLDALPPQSKPREREKKVTAASRTDHRDFGRRPRLEAEIEGRRW